SAERADQKPAAPDGDGEDRRRHDVVVARAPDRALELDDARELPERREIAVGDGHRARSPRSKRALIPRKALALTSEKGVRPLFGQRDHQKGVVPLFRDAPSQAPSGRPEARSYASARSGGKSRSDRITGMPSASARAAGAPLRCSRTPRMPARSAPSTSCRRLSPTITASAGATSTSCSAAE